MVVQYMKKHDKLRRWLGAVMISAVLGGFWFYIIFFVGSPPWDPFIPAVIVAVVLFLVTLPIAALFIFHPDLLD